MSSQKESEKMIHPTNSPQVSQDKAQLLISKLITTLIALQVQADEIGGDVDVAVARCKFIRKIDGGCEHCPFWNGKECILSKWKEILTEDYGWTPEVLAELQGFIPHGDEEYEI